MSKVFCRVAVALLLCVGASLPLAAQSTVNGAISGVVRDPQEAIVPAATVTVRNEGTNQEQTATTDDEGRFRVALLPPGNYTVTVNAGSFAAFTQQNVVVEVGQITPLDVTLGVTGGTADVEVIAEAPVINSERQDFATNINQTSINELPINGRRANNFVLLTPATVPDGNFGLISFRGISGLLNNSTVDGGDNNQAFFGEERGRTRISYVISQSAIREFQVNTSNFSAEYGRAAGGVINAVTKSGTNEFHGSGFYYNRNNRLGARNPRAFRSVFANGVASLEPLKPKDVRQQFGGTIGGPIVKDRLFFFFSYDQQERDFPGLGIFSSANYLNTVDRAFLTTPIGVRVNPTSATDLRTGRGLTSAQIDTTLGFLNSLTGEVPRQGDQKLFLPKIDWQINQSNTFTATYNRLRWDSPSGIQTQPTNTLGRASFGDDFVNVDFLNLRLNSTISPTVLNEARFQFGRDNEFQISQAPIAGEPMTAIGGSSPNVTLTNGLSFGKPTFLERRAFPDERRIQFADTVTFSFGRNSLKVGADINHVRDIFDNLRFESGSYLYGNINDFIVDYTNFRTPLAATTPCATSTRTAGRCYTGSYQQGFGQTRNELSTTEYNFFVQDDIRVSPRLTLNLGLRYEYMQFPDPQFPNTSAATGGTTLVPNRNFTVAEATSFQPSDKDNFAPRIGFAYGLSDDLKTVVRGGYGVVHARASQNSTIANTITNTGAAGGQAQISLSPTNPAQLALAPIFPNILAVAPPAGSSAIQYFARNYEAPVVHQVDFIFEREIARNTVVSASYLGAFGRGLTSFIDQNLSPSTASRTFFIQGGDFNGQTFTLPVFTGTRPNTSFAQITEVRSDVKSEYNALVLQVNRRFTDGLQFQSSYTLARATDTGQTSATFTLNNSTFNPFDRSLDQGPSNFDVRHKFVASAVYTPDFFGDADGGSFGRTVFNGFNIAPVVSIYSGRPFNANITGNLGGGVGSGITGAGGSSFLPIAGRNEFREPKIVNVDLRVSRRFNLGEERNIELLGEVFNLFNRTQGTEFNTTGFALNTVSATNASQFPGLAIGSSVLVPNADFGSITTAGGTIFRERQVQLALRFEF